MEIIKRKIIEKISRFVNTKDVVVIHGARQVGKTSILKYLQNQLDAHKEKTLFIDLEDFRFVELFNKGYEEVVKYLQEKAGLDEKKLYLFVDEIQYLDKPSSFLKLMHDHYGDKIKLFVSGSSSFEIKSKFKDSLVGRTVDFEVFPLSFEEFLTFNKYKVDFSKELTNVTVKELKELYVKFVFYGGYPRIVLENKVSNKEVYLQQIVDTYVRKDIRDLANIRDINKFNILLQVLASQSGKLLNVLELANTAKLSRQTVEHYLFLMENTYIIKLIYPYSGNLRSELSKMPKIFFYDSGIASLLNYKAFLNKVEGNLFETSVFGEIIKNKSQEEILYWRTQDKKEIDFVLRKGKKIIPVEVKVSQSNFKQTALKYFSEEYSIKNSICVSMGLEGKIKDNIMFCYPWEFLKVIKAKFGD